MELFTIPQFDLPSLAELNQLAFVLSQHLKPGMLVYLRGELGSGKTTLVQSFLHALGYTKPVTSPTFAILKFYQFGAHRVYHIDAFRLEGASNLSDLDEALYSDDALTFIEWPEMIADYLPPEATTIFFSLIDGVHYVRLESNDFRAGEMFQSLHEVFHV